MLQLNAWLTASPPSEKQPAQARAMGGTPVKKSMPNAKIFVFINLRKNYRNGFSLSTELNKDKPSRTAQATKPRRRSNKYPTSAHRHSETWKTFPARPVPVPLTTR